MKRVALIMGFIVLTIYGYPQEASFRSNLDIKKQPEVSSGNFSSEINTDSISVKTFPANSGWGYDIFINDKKYIHQEYIPAISGNKPFKSKNEAEITAGIVKEKIRKNIIPPSVTTDELITAGVNIK